jgi:hypothetical protein
MANQLSSFFVSSDAYGEPRQVGYCVTQGPDRKWSGLSLGRQPQPFARLSQRICHVSGLGFAGMPAKKLISGFWRIGNPHKAPRSGRKAIRIQTRSRRAGPSDARKAASSSHNLGNRPAPLQARCERETKISMRGSSPHSDKVATSRTFRRSKAASSSHNFGNRLQAHCERKTKISMRGSSAAFRPLERLLQARSPGVPSHEPRPQTLRCSV